LRLKTNIGLYSKYLAEKVAVQSFGEDSKSFNKEDILLFKNKM
jgi:hypothetical protein